MRDDLLAPEIGVSAVVADARVVVRIRPVEIEEEQIGGDGVGQRRSVVPPVLVVPVGKREMIRIRQRDYLIKITQILTQELELEPLLWQVIQMAVDLVGGESGFVALYDESKGWQIQTQMNLTEPELKYIENRFIIKW